MKKLKKVKTKSKMNKKKKIIITIILILILISIGVFVLNILENDTNLQDTIIATKTISEENQAKQDIKYIIKMKDYNLEDITKEITFETEQEAKAEYERYKIINKYEKREIGLELQKKKLILTLPEEQLKQELEYEEYKNITMIISSDERKEVINQEYLKELLQDQGYTIK